MDMKEMNELFERLIVAEGAEAAGGDCALALAVRLSGMEVANGLAMVAQNLGEIRDEMLNQRLQTKTG